MTDPAGACSARTRNAGFSVHARHVAATWKTRGDSASRGAVGASVVADHIALRVDPSQLRNVHLELAQRLTRDAGMRVSLVAGRAQ